MIDLHCHSTISDGKLTPTQVVQLAQENGCTMLALTDHDHTGGVLEARAQAEKCGITLINGVEISVTWHHRTIHIIGLDFNLHDNNLQNLLKKVRQGRLERLAAICAKLEKKGIRGAYEGSLALATNPEMVSRTHIAQFLIDNEYVSKKQQAFKQYLGEGKSCSVAHQWAQLDECVDAIEQAGGIAVIAHPMRYDFSATAKRRLLEEFKALGGAGIEVHSGRYDKNDTLNYALLAERFGLLASAGSDFHALGDYTGGILGTCPELPERCRPVWEHFQMFQTAF